MNIKKKSSVVHKVFAVAGAILCVVFGFMLICNMTILVKGVINPDIPPSVMGITPMAVQSGSMSGAQEGHIEVGDLIFISKVDAEDLQRGDVIAFMEGGIAVTHRIVDMETDENGVRQFITKGDANNVADQNPVKEEQIVGIYKGRVPRLGDFAMFLQEPIGMMIFIGIPVLAFLIYDIIRRHLETVRAQKRNAEREAKLEQLHSFQEKEADTGKKLMK